MNQNIIKIPKKKKKPYIKSKHVFSLSLLPSSPGGRSDMWDDCSTNQQLSCRGIYTSPDNIPFTITFWNLLVFQESDCNHWKLPHFPDEVNIQKRCLLPVEEQGRPVFTAHRRKPNRMQRWRVYQANVFLKLFQMSLLESKGLKSNLCLGHSVLIRISGMSQLKHGWHWTPRKL